MYLIPGGGKSSGYDPVNTKWGGISTLQTNTASGQMCGLLPGGGLRFFRPNQTMARGFYPGGGLGDDSSISVDPSLLLPGIGLLALGMLLWGRKHPKKRKPRRRPGRVRRALSELGTA